MRHPSYNHTRGDSALKPCAECIRVLEGDALTIGTDNQRERWRAGVLPEDELCALARTELYRPLVDIKRWSPIRPTEMRHYQGCNRPLGSAPIGTPPFITYETTEVSELTHDEWERLRVINGLVKTIPGQPWVEPRSHWAECTFCHAEVARSSVRVVVPWAGRELVREYAI